MHIRSNIPQVQQGVLKLARQAPFAMSLALNDLANQFQRVEQEHVLRVFEVKQRSFILNTIKRLPGQDFATKQHLISAVRIDPTRNQLAKWEQGGTKVAIQGKPYVAIPSKDVKRTKKGLVPRKFYPGNFSPFTEQGKRVLGKDRSFIVEAKSGLHVLLQRFGGARGRSGIRRIAFFKSAVNLGPGRLEFHDIAVEVARSSWLSVMASAWRRALSTAR